MQHQAYASWMREIFAVARFRRAAGLGHEHDDFFTCGEGKDLSLSFKLRHMDEKATHVVFLLPEPSTAWLDEKGLLRTDPDAASYPGQVSLGRNRAVWYVSPDDARDFGSYTPSAWRH